MKRTLFRIAYALGLKRLANRISPSLYCMELGKIMAKNFEKGFKIALADVEGQAAFQQRLQEWLTEDHIEEEARRKMTVKEAIYELDFALGEIYDQVFYNDKPYEFDKDGYEALDMAVEALKQTRWVPCSERLPEEDGQYLITVKYVHVDGYEDIYAEHGDWADGKWDMFCFGHCGEVESILAWMPLPKPWKGEQNE